jgi:myo-inositol 2-dehydrogenase/D-chiro-inositol 1-dehydrogenase
MMILVVLRFGTAMAVIDEYLIFGGFNRDTPTYTWTIFMYDQAFKQGLWRQGYAAAIGMIGAVAMMTHSMTSAFPAWSEGGWLADPARSGGPLLDLAVHSFDYLAWVSGARAVRVHAVAGDTPVGPATYALATVRYDNGAMAQVQASWANPAARGFRLDCELVGSDGRVAWDYDSIRNGELHRGDGSSEVFFPLGERGYAAELAAFTEAARAGGPSPVPVEAGYEALRTALAAQRSLETGEPVDLTSWEAA